MEGFLYWSLQPQIVKQFNFSHEAFKPRTKTSTPKNGAGVRQTTKIANKPTFECCFWSIDGSRQHFHANQFKFLAGNIFILIFVPLNLYHFVSTSITRLSSQVPYEHFILILKWWKKLWEINDRCKYNEEWTEDDKENERLNYFPLGFFSKKRGKFFVLLLWGGIVFGGKSVMHVFCVIIAPSTTLLIFVLVVLVLNFSK